LDKSKVFTEGQIVHAVPVLKQCFQAFVESYSLVTASCSHTTAESLVFVRIVRESTRKNIYSSISAATAVTKSLQQQLHVLDYAALPTTCA